MMSKLAFLWDDPYQVSVPFLYTLKTSKNVWFADASVVWKGKIGLKWFNGNFN